jgi:hypothetical protein
MSTTISNPSADRNEKIVSAIDVLGKSIKRKLVFEAIYTGKKKIKSVSDIMVITKMSRIRVLQEIDNLVQHDIVKRSPDRINNETTYEKIGFYQQNKRKILSGFNCKEKRDKIPTRSNPQVKIIIPKNNNKPFSIELITIDDIDNFKKVTRISKTLKAKPIVEKEFKELIQKIIGEKGKFQDWGGEQNDLYTTRVKIKGKRKSASFAFKGKGKKGTLKPKMMGKNGDQIQRLFLSSSNVFILQYHDMIDQSIYDMMQTYAITKSTTENMKIYYCIIDGIDTQRIIKTYK